MIASRRNVALSLLFSLLLPGCAAAPEGVGAPPLRPCPDSPNCVSSLDQDDAYAAPFLLASPHDWATVADIVSGLPRTTVVTLSDTYLHAECRSRIFRFVDDLELSLDPAQGSVAVRSASRLGYSDLGVNRRRVEELRRKLRDAGLLLRPTSRKALD